MERLSKRAPDVNPNNRPIAIKSLMQLIKKVCLPRVMPYNLIARRYNKC